MDRRTTSITKVPGAATTKAGTAVPYTEYVPAFVESFMVQNAVKLGYDTNVTARELAAGCPIWIDPNATSPTLHAQLEEYLIDLDEYGKRVKDFQRNVSDLRLRLDDPEDVCRTVDLIDNNGLFQRSHQLSFTASGYVEPLLPPMRHPAFCVDANRLMDFSYIVHDFGRMCRKLNRQSRIVFVDAGASLKTWGAIHLIDTYHKFGLPFDHIYAYEIVRTNPRKVFNTIPSHLLPAYHWINVGVDVEPGHRLNPFTMLKDKYDKDDLIIFKLDIDTPSVEMALVKQLLHDDALADLVDQFYFEHHVYLKELEPYWKANVNGTVKESLDLFQALRKKGVAAHFWI
jgi:hypothetical protein